MLWYIAHWRGEVVCSLRVWCFVHRRKVEDDYGALQERLGTLPDKLSYSIMVGLLRVSLKEHVVSCKDTTDIK